MRWFAVLWGTINIGLILVMVWNAYTVVPGVGCYEFAPAMTEPAGLTKIHFATFAVLAGFSVFGWGARRLVKALNAYNPDIAKRARIFIILVVWLFLTAGLFLLHVFIGAAVMETFGGCAGFCGSQVDRNNTTLYISLSIFMALFLAWPLVLVMYGFPALFAAFFLLPRPDEPKSQRN